MCHNITICYHMLYYAIIIALHRVGRIREGGMIRSETLIELKLLNSSCSS